MVGGYRTKLAVIIIILSTVDLVYPPWIWYIDSRFNISTIDINCLLLTAMWPHYGASLFLSLNLSLNQVSLSLSQSLNYPSFNLSIHLQSCLVVPEEEGYTVHASSQWASLTQAAVASVLNVPQSRCSPHTFQFSKIIELLITICTM